MWENIKRLFNNLKIGLALGMKTADDQLMHKDIVADGIGSEINQQQNEHRVAQHLLNGEVTEEVKELVWRTMKVDRESRSYEMYSPLKAVKRPSSSGNRKPKIYNKEKYQLLTIQDNRNIGDNVNEALEKIDSDKVEVNKNGEICQNIGRLKKSHEYTLKIGRSRMFTPRYYIEEYTNKIVCFVVNEEKNDYMLDFYVSKYPNDKEYKSKGFVREIEYIKNDRRRSDVVDIKSVEFVTFNAYSFYDGLLFSFDKLSFDSIVEYDGSYVIRFRGVIVENGKDFFDEEQCESMKRKYEEKASKNRTINYDPYNLGDIRTYVCSMCGKEVTYSQKDIDAKEASEEAGGSEVTEYMDMEATEQTFGKMICKDCMEKHRAEIYAKLTENLEKRQ